MNTYKLFIFDWEGTLMAPQGELFPGVRQLLSQLQQQNILLAVASNCMRYHLDRMLKAHDLQGIFAATRCADETDYKPATLMLEEILAELDTVVPEALMIGDSDSDMAMAQALKMDRIGIDPEDPEESHLHRYKPLMVVREIANLMKNEKLVYINQ